MFSGHDHVPNLYDSKNVLFLTIDYSDISVPLKVCKSQIATLDLSKWVNLVEETPTRT